MGAWLNRFLKILDLLLRWYIVALMALLVFLTFVQVMARYVMNSPFTGTDQMARICLVWLTFMGAAVAVRQGKNIRIETLERYFPQKFKKLLTLVFDLVLLVLLVMLVIKGYQVAEISTSQQILATPFSYAALYSSLVGGAVLMLLYVAVRVLVQVGVLEADLLSREGRP